MIATYRGGIRHKYAVGGDIFNLSLDDISNFLNAYDLGALQPIYKSEPEPSKQNKVLKIVGTSHARLI